MPVTIRPTSNRAELVRNNTQTLDISEINRSILQPAARPDKKTYKLLQSSYHDSQTTSRKNSMNGFVKAAIEAYSSHHHLHIRADDVWLAILTQFSAYVNANAESLRDKFVEHEGQKHLVIQYGPSSRHTFDFGRFAKDMGELLKTEVKDSSLRDWIIPAFTTTTPNDVVVSSIVMMATLQEYFSYECMMMCGLPSVTLLGEKADYELILSRLEYLHQFGEEPATFAEYLKPVIRHFISSFDEPNSKATTGFWNKIASQFHRGSGSAILTGWITSFCFWDEDGRVMLPTKNRPWGEVQYGVEISSSNVPAGHAMVPVKVNDIAEEVETIMVAGSLSIEIKKTGMVMNTMQPDTLQPELGWLMFEEVDGKQEHRIKGDRRKGDWREPRGMEASEDESD